MNKRLEMLKKMVAASQADSFARYALALEFKKEGAIDEALGAFQQLREADADYLPQYLIAGQMLIDADRIDEAREWLEPGLALAQRTGNGQAAGELQAALADC